MAFNKINIGTSANDGTGDKLRTAFEKINSNIDKSYTKEEVNDLIEGVEVDLSDYDTKSQVNNKITLAIESLFIPTKTSDLINDGNGDSNKPFLTIDDIPSVAASTIDQVLLAGNQSNRMMRLGRIEINSSHLVYKMQIFNDSGVAKHKWATDGEYEIEGKISIASDDEGYVEFQKNSLGVIKVNNLNYNRSTMLKFAPVTSDAIVMVPNKSGTLAMISDIPTIPTDFVPEAPIDGETYGRSGGTWVPISGGGGGTIDPTNQNIAKQGAGYKLLTRTISVATLGTNSLMWGTAATGVPYTTGTDSVAFGENQKPEGVRSFLIGSGNRTRSTATNGGAFGGSVDMQGNSSYGIGFDLRGSNKVGQVIVGAYSLLATQTTTQQFIVAIGTNGDRQHGLEVLDKANKGFVRAPYQQAPAMYADADDKILVHKEYVEFYYTPRIVTTDLAARVTNLENASTFTVDNFNAMLDNATPEQINEIKLKLGIV